MRQSSSEFRTGLLVVVTMVVLVGTLIYLGAPGALQKQHTYYIYFENASGVRQGADVLLAGRKIGQVHDVFSPVPDKDRPEPKYESLMEVRVEAKAAIYNKVRAQMVQLSMLGDPVLDFTGGDESSGLAPQGTRFLGERQPGLADAVPEVMSKLDPVLHRMTDTLDSLTKTADNLNRLTSDGGDIQVAVAQFKQFGVHLNEMSGPDSSLRKAFANIEQLTGPDSKLALTLDHTEEFTSKLAKNSDLDQTLANLRKASEKMNRMMADAAPRISVIATNLEQASDTVKHQPWRLIWPSTKKYDQEGKPAEKPLPVAERPRGRRR